MTYDDWKATDPADRDIKPEERCDYCGDTGCQDCAEEILAWPPLPESEQ